MNDIELSKILEQRTDCAIRCALRDCIPISFRDIYRASTRNKNKKLTKTWNYSWLSHEKLLPIFVSDLLLIGRSVLTGNQDMDIARYLTLTQGCIDYFHYGLIGQYYSGYSDTDHAFYQAGVRLRRVYRSKSYD